MNLSNLAMPLKLPAMHLQASMLHSGSHRLSALLPGTATIVVAILLVTAPAGFAADGSPQQPLVKPQPIAPTAALPNPKTAKDFNLRGTTKAQNRDFEGAIADFSQAIQLKRDYAAAYYNRGTAYAQVGNARATLADYTQVIFLKPNNAAIRYSRGSIRASVGDRQGAIADFQQAATLFKQEGNTLYAQRAQAHIKQLQQPDPLE